MAVSQLAPAKVHHPAPAGSRRWGALALVLVAVFMDLIDITMVVIAAPSIQDELGMSYSAIQWVMAGYVLALGLLLITGGRLCDLFGRKRLFLTGVALFAAASTACGLAPSIGALVVARAVQGGAAALMVPQVLATIQVDFHPAERPRAFGLYGAVNGLAAAAGPIVGGLLVGADAFGLGWRSVFWINVPIGLCTLLGAALLLRESRAAHRPRLDVPGVVVLTAGLMLLLYPLIQGAEIGGCRRHLRHRAGARPRLRRRGSRRLVVPDGRVPAGPRAVPVAPGEPCGVLSRRPGRAVSGRRRASTGTRWQSPPRGSTHPSSLGCSTRAR